MEGPDCLVFFLGGIPQKTANGWAVAGFGTNPLNPMAGSVPATAWPNRTPPLFEFNNSRLDDNYPRESRAGEGNFRTRSLSIMTA